LILQLGAPAEVVLINDVIDAGSGATKKGKVIIRNDLSGKRLGLRQIDTGKKNGSKES
jgi:hypothetical protein